MGKCPLFDSHCDTASQIFNKECDLYDNSLHVDLRRGSEYSPYVQIFAIFAPDEFETKYYWIMENLKYQLAINKEKVRLCRTAQDIHDCEVDNISAALISVEGAELLGCDIDKLVHAKDDGVSSVNITWNYANKLSGSNADTPDMGLTKRGMEFVGKCFEIGAAVDVSHISDPAFWDVCCIAEKYGKPFYASHSNSRALCSNKRNLTDDQFRAIVDCGGVAGLNMYASFLGDNADISTVIRHIDRFLELGGAKSIAIGADFDGCNLLPKEISGIQDMHRLYDELILRGYGEELAGDIFYNNQLRFFSEILK